MTHQPAHENGSVVVKTGFHITIPVPIPTGRGKSRGYWRHAVSVDTHQWLLENVGPTDGQHHWELLGKGAWLHTGTTQQPHSHELGNETPLLAHFWFRDRRLAVLFVLTWKNRM